MRNPRSVVITPFDETGRKIALAVRRSLRELGIETYDLDDIQDLSHLADLELHVKRAARRYIEQVASEA